MATAAATRASAIGSRAGQPVASVPRPSHSAAKPTWISEPILATRRRQASRAATGEAS
jgi:hypothetical protein